MKARWIGAGLGVAFFFAAWLALLVGGHGLLAAGRTEREVARNVGEREITDQP